MFLSKTNDTVKAFKLQTKTSLEAEKENSECLRIINNVKEYLQIYKQLDILESDDDLSSNDIEEIYQITQQHALKNDVVPRPEFVNFAKPQLIEFLYTNLKIHRAKHIEFLFHHLQTLPSSYFEVDSSKPWVVFWITHSLSMLNAWTNENQRIKYEILMLLETMKTDEGAYGGGPGQLAHLATTFAAICSLIELGDEDIWVTIQRKQLYSYLVKLKTGEGSFFMHSDGEIDVRGAYCAAAIASLLCFPTEKLFVNTDSYVKSLQTYDGGIAGEPATESHAAYTYCGLATLAILNKYRLLNLEKLLFWAVHRQLDHTGGFQGRINKTSDSCYSFWGAGILSIFSYLEIFLPQSTSFFEDQWFNSAALQIFILGCCQDTYDNVETPYHGGFCDRPTSLPELYHTCYALSGLSLCQYTSRKKPLPIAGLETNRLQPVHPIYNICMEKWEQSQKFFSNLPPLE